VTSDARCSHYEEIIAVNTYQAKYNFITINNNNNNRLCSASDLKRNVIEYYNRPKLIQERQSSTGIRRSISAYYRVVSVDRAARSIDNANRSIVGNIKAQDVFTYPVKLFSDL